MRAVMAQFELTAEFKILNPVVSVAATVLCKATVTQHDKHKGRESV